MERQCRNCGEVFEHGNSDNMIIFCPNCKKTTGSISEYGFGPITPCDIYFGNMIIGHISEDYFLSSTEFNIQKQLISGYEGYKQLAAYQEAEDILESYLESADICNDKSVQSALCEEGMNNERSRYPISSSNRERKRRKIVSWLQRRL